MSKVTETNESAFNDMCDGDSYIIDIVNKQEQSKRNTQAQARRHYERLQEERQLKALLDDEFASL